MQLLLRLVLLSSAFFTSQSYALPQQALVPGGIALLGLPDYQEGTIVKFENERVAVFKHGQNWIALAGISLDTKPGDYEFSIEHHTGLKLNTRVTIKDKKYKEQHLTIKKKRKVNPSEEDLKRIASERIRKHKARSLRTDTVPDIDFIWPVTGDISSIFGLKRFFNQQKRNPHNGLDIAAAEGTPVKAVADGTIIEAGDFFFSGNMIYVDHGQVIITLYAHLSRIDVKPGDKVRKGQVIGAVGQTGRVTGPHLHFAVYANKALIDPIYLLPEIEPVTAKKP